MALAANAVHIGRARAAMEALKSIASAVVEDGEEKHVETIKAAPRVFIEDVSFRYHGEARAVLKNLLLTVEPVERVALVDPSGLRKSMLGSLLDGLGPYTPAEIVISTHGALWKSACSRWPKTGAGAPSPASPKTDTPRRRPWIGR